ncbi:MAG: CPBP family intramembrane metalloprotease [Spirochaetes bacterium]|jgi:membrane protease YdiL (CAAX protease family)|nr:CPBP family intramembrane metalloprotease [Spirochaetota bacterium]
MIGLFAIIGFPAITGIAFGFLYRGAPAILPGLTARHVQRYNTVIYTGLLAIPVMAVLLAPHSLSATDLGVAWPAIEGMPGPASLLIAAAGGAAVGVALYRAEVALVNRRAEAAGGTPSRTSEHEARSTKTAVDKEEQLAYLMDGKTEETTATMRTLPAPALLALTITSVTAEEVLWRGYLYTALTSLDLMPAVAAFGVSAVSFGSIHVHFGLWGVVTKCLWGAVWGLLFVLTGSLVAPVASHLAFNVMALGFRIDWDDEE